MSQECFLEIVATVVCKGEKWEGCGFWPLPSASSDWQAVVMVVTRAVAGSVPALGMHGRRYKLEVRAQAVDLQGDLAAKMRERSGRFALDDPRQLTWSLRKAPRFTTQVKDDGEGTKTETLSSRPRYHAGDGGRPEGGQG